MKIDKRSIISFAILVFFATTILVFYKPYQLDGGDGSPQNASRTRRYYLSVDDTRPIHITSPYEDDESASDEYWDSGEWWYRDDRAPDWVNNHNVSHLFDWTWHKTTDFIRSGYTVSKLESNKVYTRSQQIKVVVNDVLRYLHDNPDQGIVVDDFNQLPNPVPHPTPRDSHSFRNNRICDKLNIRDKWLACMLPDKVLSQAMPYTRKFVTVGIYNAFIDYGSCNDQVPGTVFTNDATYHFQRWTNSPCFNDVITTTKNVQSYDALIDPLGVYGSAFGHYPNQQFPRLLRLLATVPQDVKVLTPVDGIAGQLIEILIEKKILTKDRIVPVQRDITYHAKIVYRSEAYPYLKGDQYGHYLHDRTDMELVHRVMMTDLYHDPDLNVQAEDDERNYIVVMKRGRGSRYLENMDDMIEMLETLKPANTEIKFFTGEGHVRDHMKLFNRAYMVIGVHGAGFINVMWCQPGTYILEIGYDKGMSMPSMYYEMATHSDHIYRLIEGTGDYSGGVTVDLIDLSLVLYMEQLRVTKSLKL